jgi:transposase-like protein
VFVSVDRGWLEEQLAAGRSIESIAREVNRHPSTVSYWMRKHGLRSSHADRHASRGGIERGHFAAIVACGLPVRDMAEAMNVSPTTVRYWLRRYGLTTGPAQRRAKVAEAAAHGERYVELTCYRHGPTRHTWRADGYRCARCESERVTAWRQRTKQRLVDEAGGACALCGYDRCLAALQFHHIDPSEKSFALSHGGLARSLERAREEAQKCILLCANCHAEVEAGVAELPLAADGAAPEADPG